MLTARKALAKDMPKTCRCGGAAPPSGGAAPTPKLPSAGITRLPNNGHSHRAKQQWAAPMLMASAEKSPRSFLPSFALACTIAQNLPPCSNGLVWRASVLKSWHAVSADYRRICFHRSASCGGVRSPRAALVAMSPSFAPLSLYLQRVSLRGCAVQSTDILHAR